MDGGRMSDFSIERILSPQLGPRPQVADVPHGGCLQRLPGFGLDFGYIGPPALAPCCQRYRGTAFGEACYACGPGFHRPDFQHCCGACVHFGSRDSADAPLCAGYHLYQRPGAPPPAQHPQRTRMRTVFTDSQTRQLEALFELTDYPPVEARAEIARRAGLSEETVRVWFKNRRARRKRQCTGPGAGSPPPPLSGGQRSAPSSDSERTGPWVRSKPLQA